VTNSETTAAETAPTLFSLIIAICLAVILGTQFGPGIPLLLTAWYVGYAGGLVAGKRALDDQS
jgi:hypothetical protein